MKIKIRPVPSVVRLRDTILPCEVFSYIDDTNGTKFISCTRPTEILYDMKVDDFLAGNFLIQKSNPTSNVITQGEKITFKEQQQTLRDVGVCDVIEICKKKFIVTRLCSNNEDVECLNIQSGDLTTFQIDCPCLVYGILEIEE